MEDIECYKREQGEIVKNIQCYKREQDDVVSELMREREDLRSENVKLQHDATNLAEVIDLI